MLRIAVKALCIFCFLCTVGAEEVMVDPPKTMNPEWERKFLGVRKDVTDVVGAVEELTAGITPNFGEEFLSKLRTAVNRQPTGEYAELWPNGKLKARIGFKNRQAHGHVHGWYEDGTDAFKGYFQEGIKQGIHISFFPYSPDRVSDVARVLVYNEKGLLDDKQLTMHYATGQLNIYVDYKEGLAEGPLECWDVKGTQYLSANYNHGQLQKYPPPAPAQRGYRFKPFLIYVNEIIRRFETEVEAEYDLVATSSGGDMPKDLEVLSVGFIKHKKTTIEEARVLMVALKDKFVSIVNAHEKIRPYLREYPFSPDRTRVNLTFRKDDGVSPYGEDGVDFVLMGRGHIIHYEIDDPKNPNRYKQVHEEPYEEAVKIVKGSSKP